MSMCYAAIAFSSAPICYVMNYSAIAIYLVFIFGEVTKASKNQMTTMNTFAVTREFHTNGVRQHIYVEGYHDFFAMNINKQEYGFVQTFTIFFLDFFGLLFYVPLIVEGLPHSRRASVRMR